MKIYLHPDALYDEPYQETELAEENYKIKNFYYKQHFVSKSAVTVYGQNNNFLRLDACSDKMIRLRFGFGQLQNSLTERLNLINANWEGSNVSSKANEKEIIFETDSIKFSYILASNEFTISDKAGKILLSTKKGGLRYSEMPPDYDSGNRFLSFFNLDSDERVFGFGGRTMPPNRTGTTVDIFSEKVGALLGDYGGCPIPYFISTKGYGVFVNNPWPHLYFDMGKTNQDEWFLHAPGGEFDMFLFTGNTFGELLGKYTQITGRVPVCDKSMLGFWCSSINFEEDKEVLDTVSRLHKEGYPCDTVVIDGAWRGGKAFLKAYSLDGQYPTNDMDWHPDFGDGPAMINLLSERNVKLSLHLNSRNFLPKTYIPAVKQGLLRQQEEECVADFKTLKAKQYYKNLIKPRIHEGVKIWWTDHADRISGEIDKGVPSRNLFGVLWNKLIAEAMEEEGIYNHLALTRGSGIGGQKYGCPWPGDTKAGVDRFGEDIWFCLNAGLSGFALTSCDLGGFFTEIPEGVKYKPEIDPAFDTENICRRILQCSMFIPLPRLHNHQSTAPKLPWICPESTRKLYKETLRFRYEMTPYIYSAAICASKTGEPIIRPLVYHNINDTSTYDCNDQLYLGDSIIFAPVIKSGVTKRNVYLPEGNWIDMWTGKEYQGPANVVADAPLYELRGMPAFVKKGAIIVKQPFTLTLSNDIVPELILEIYPDDNGAVTLWEGDTISNTFAYAKTNDKLHLTLENNTSVDRKYSIKVLGKEALTVNILAHNIISIALRL